MARRKNGEYFVQNLKIIPIIGSNGFVFKSYFFIVFDVNCLFT